MFHVSQLKRALPCGTVAATLPPKMQVDEHDPVLPEAVLATREGRRNGKSVLEWLILWKAQPVEEATWEVAEKIKERFPSLCLEDKAEIKEGGIDRNPFPIVPGQPRPTIEKPLKVYSRRPKCQKASTTLSGN